MNEEQHATLIRIDERTAHLVDACGDMEVRLRRLERFRNWCAGIIAAVTGAVGVRNSTNFL